MRDTESATYTINCRVPDIVHVDWFGRQGWVTDDAYDLWLPREIILEARNILRTFREPKYQPWAQPRYPESP